jgi:hypothetical protein
MEVLGIGFSPGKEHCVTGIAKQASQNSAKNTAPTSMVMHAASKAWTSRELPLTSLQ